jgi:hypothetical protein
MRCSLIALQGPASTMSDQPSVSRTLLAAATSVMLLTGVVANPVLAQQTDQASPGESHRQLGAHVHGQGKLNIAIEAGKLEMEFEVPAADIVGFEHSAGTPEQRAALSKANADLSKPLGLFRMPPAAGCSVVNVDVKLETEGDQHAKDHGDEKGHGHEAAKSAAPKDEGRADPSGHAEFHATYRLACTAPAALATITFDYFKAFGRAQALEVNVISPKGQMRYQVTREKPSIGLAGMM